MNVGAVGVPLIDVASRGGDFVPLGVLLGEIAVELAKDFGFEGCLHLVANFLQGGPDVLEKDFAAVLALANRFFAQVNVHPARQGKGDHERRRHEEVGLDALVNARFEIAIARKDRGGDEIVFANRFVNGCRERTGIADAGGATVADEVEAELVQVGLQARFV